VEEGTEAVTVSIVQADVLDFLRAQPEGSVDLVFGSPPYEQARLYLEGGENLGISRKTDAWVAWMVEVYLEAQRACKGLVAFVVAGQTRNYRWSAGPALLMAELHRAGLNLRNPPLFSRVGIPGSGGPDWLRSDYEWIVCTSRPGKLPWSNNTACGHPPKWAPGGAMSNRHVDGRRINDRAKNNKPGKFRRATSGHKNGDTQNSDSYAPPALANPGNIIKCIVGGGVMGGDEYASQNEAPFPEKLAEFFVLSFCPPGGTVCDPFSGSGTTAAVAVRHGRNFVGCDLRQSQVELGLKRVASETPTMFS
jgi:DNA modification methylase